MADAVDKSIYLLELRRAAHTIAYYPRSGNLWDNSLLRNRNRQESASLGPSLRPHCELKRWVCWRSAGWRLAVAFCSRELWRFWLLSPICLFSNICIHILLLEWAVVDAILHEFIEVGHLCLRYSYRNPEDSIREFLSVPYAKVVFF